MDDINNWKHIDDWIEERMYGRCTDEERYALAFFFVKAMDSVSNITLRPIMEHHKLFCEYKDKKYRVTGCSTMGDIWLHDNFEIDHGYTNRVNVDLCSNWSSEANLS